jgi:hypothetical protein
MAFTQSANDGIKPRSSRTCCSPIHLTGDDFSRRDGDSVSAAVAGAGADEGPRTLRNKKTLLIFDAQSVFVLFFDSPGLIFDARPVILFFDNIGSF